MPGKMKAFDASPIRGTPMHIEVHLLVVMTYKNSLETTQSKSKYFAFSPFVQ